MAVEMGGLTFAPGSYRSGTINIAAGTTVTLDGGDHEDPVFTFQATTTLVTGAGVKFVLKNVKPANIKWTLGTAANLGVCARENRHHLLDRR